MEPQVLPAALAAHAPALLVMIPLIMSAPAAMIKNGRVAWAIAVLSVLASLVLAAEIFLATRADGAIISYAMGGWEPPFGIEYRIDALNAALLLLLGSTGFLALMFAGPSVADEIARGKRSLFYSAFLICFAGLSGVASTGDAFNLFVFLEISSIATYAIIAMGWRNDRQALTASFNYLVMGTIGATFFVIGVGFIYMTTGTLNMADQAQAIAAMNGNRAVEVGFAFILVGIGLKAALFPLHQWLPNAYAYAPNFVTTFLATTATKVAFYVIIRYSYDVFSVHTGFVSNAMIWVITPLAIAGMLVASTQALFQNNVRRLFAYSSVAQVGYMMLGLGMATSLGLAAGMLHLINHAMMKGALFMALGAFALSYGIRRIEDFKGLGQAMPVTSAAFTVGALSLVGVPFTVGFISKFYLIQAALDAGWWWAVAAILISSVIAVFYVYRILVAIWVTPQGETDKGAPRRVPLAIAVPLGVLALANLVFGVYADPIVSIARAAADAAVYGGVTP
ncbi:monovalent cation/H+ antiporter subunit D family protein [Alkalicaulis satelles]|uniref:Monovalent cation/H+ antiporter subunit D family protein n=2 Tax=Alkalicaulis satelles TaxID=2609175 RepID=A0A5M6ZKM0_9PROT|nr:monovalent cation/H+ antiporter subunit D family protein [Alkalicaulis satelles]